MCEVLWLPSDFERSAEDPIVCLIEHLKARRSANRRSYTPGFAPADEPVIVGRCGGGALEPLCSRWVCSEPPESAAQYPTVIDARDTTRLARRQRLDDRPFLVCQFVSQPRHSASMAIKTQNQANGQTSSRFMSLRPSKPHGPLSGGSSNYGHN